MATSKERQTARDQVAKDNGKKLDKIIELLESLKGSTKGEK